MQKSIFTSFHIKEMRVEAQVGIHIREALEEALNLAKQIKGRIILEWNKMVDIYIDKDDKIRELLQIWEEYLAIRKERIIVNEDAGEARKIKIIAIKNVKAKYSNKKGYIGLLAKDGRDRIYENNFYELEDDSLFNPYATWISKFPDDTCPFWKDIDWGYILSEKRKKLIVEQFPDDLNYCEKHKNIYWKDKKCPFCQLEEILKEAHKRTLQKGIETYKVRIKTE